MRQSLYLPLDDLLFITKQYINPVVSRADIARLLKREGMWRLTDLTVTVEGEKITPKKTFKDYEPGFIHIDIKYLPQMPDETARRYLFVAIDRRRHWVFMHIYDDMSEASSVDFLRRLKLASPIKISKILTDNGSQFTDRFATKDKKPSGKHVSTSPVEPCQPSMGWHCRAIRKPTVWSSVSTAESTNCYTRPVSTAGPICRPHC